MKDRAALVLFLVVKAINKMKDKLVKKEEKNPEQSEKREMPDESDQVGNSPILDGMNTDKGGDVNG